MHRVSVDIPQDWTAEQAMAVIDLLDDLREKIWALYELRLIDAYRTDRQTEYDPGPPDDPPF